MGRQGGVYNTYRIPFGNGIRVTVLPTTDDFGTVTRNLAWWIIRGSRNLPITIGGVKLPASARLRLHRLENYTAKPLEEFTVAQATARGALYQVFVAVIGGRDSNTWEDQSYQEGCVRAYFNGSQKAVLLSSGLEDYFVSSGYFHHQCFIRMTFLD
jgi:hypothetical protein